MREDRAGTKLQLWYRARAAALVPAIAAVATVAMSPVGAEVARADGPSAAHRGAGVIYGGLTSNEWPVIVEVTPNGRQIKRVVGAIAADCTQGGTFVFPSQWHMLAISRRGAFRASFDDTDVTDNGVQVTYSETFLGKFNRARTRLTARWRASTTFRHPDGSVDTCDSGFLRVSARQ